MSASYGVTCYACILYQDLYVYYLVIVCSQIRLLGSEKISFGFLEVFTLKCTPCLYILTRQQQQHSKDMSHDCNHIIIAHIVF